MTKSWKRKRREDTEQPSDHEVKEAVLEYFENVPPGQRTPKLNEILVTRDRINARHPKP